jgi:hypothetical protein
MARAILCGLFILLLGTTALADEIAVGEGLVLKMSLPAGWALHTEAPEPLVLETAEHIEHEAEAAGKHPTEEQILRVARKRLAANEAIAYHAASGSHLDIDFSPLESDEKPPGSKVLKTSAKYAVQSLEGEEGVSQVKSNVSSAKISGSENAYRLDATYRHHDEPATFIGVIGYAERHWFFLYFTAPGQQADALQTIEELLKSLEIRSH